MTGPAGIPVAVDDDGWTTFTTMLPRWGPWRGKRVRTQKHPVHGTRHLVDDPFAREPR